MIQNQKELYKLDTDPSLDDLKTGNYITSEQADAYTKATGNH